MQVCTSSQITKPTSHHSVFYRPDALPAAQPTVSKHWRQMIHQVTKWNLEADVNTTINCWWIIPSEIGPGFLFTSGHGSWTAVKPLVQIANLHDVFGSPAMDIPAVVLLGRGWNFSVRRLRQNLLYQCDRYTAGRSHGMPQVSTGNATGQVWSVVSVV